MTRGSGEGSPGEIVVCLGLAAYFGIRSRGIVFLLLFIFSGDLNRGPHLRARLDEKGRKESRIELVKNKLILLD